MAIGERIQFFRKRKGWTQRELGCKMGFSERTADVRVAQYESGKRTPKEEMVRGMAGLLDVLPEAMSVPDIDTYLGLMHTLFALEDNYGLTVTVLDGQVCLKQDLNHPKYDRTLADDLASWNEIKTRLTSGSITREAYDHWRYHYPADRAAETRAELDSLRERKKAEEPVILSGSMSQPADDFQDNPTMAALAEAQKAFEGAAEKAGFTSEEELIEFLKEWRRQSL